MASNWRITAHPEGRWIIQSGERRCAVPADLGNLLMPLQGGLPDGAQIASCLELAGWGRRKSRATAALLQDHLEGRNPGPPSGGSRFGNRPRKAVWLRLPLVPAAGVEAMARRLVRWASWRGLWVQAVLGLGLYLGAGFYLQHGDHPPWQPDLSRYDVLLGTGLFLITALWHELGHAAALRRDGYCSAGIGLGLLFVIPVLYADVSEVSLLPRRSRLRVDAGGVCFQLALGGALFALGGFGISLPGSRAMVLAGSLAAGAAAWSLIPFIRADGYWFLCDLLDLQDLDRPAPRHRGHRLRCWLILHRLLNGLFLILVGTAFPLRCYRILLGLAEGLQLGPEVAVFAGAVLAAMIWWGLVQRLILLYSASRQDIRQILASRVCVG